MLKSFGCFISPENEAGNGKLLRIEIIFYSEIKFVLETEARVSLYVCCCELLMPKKRDAAKNVSYVCDVTPTRLQGESCT